MFSQCKIESEYFCVKLWMFFIYIYKHSGRQTFDIANIFNHSSDEENYVFFPINTLFKMTNAPWVNHYVKSIFEAMLERDFSSSFRINRRCIHSMGNKVCWNYGLHFIYFHIYALINQNFAKRRIKLESFRLTVTFKL